jgi:hypothetical protein
MLALHLVLANFLSLFLKIIFNYLSITVGFSQRVFSSVSHYLGFSPFQNLASKYVAKAN